MKRIQWKHRLVGVILLVAAVILTASFLIIYEIFVRKLEQSDFQSTTLRFQQAEEDIRFKTDRAQRAANDLIVKSSCYIFLNKQFETITQESLALREIIHDMDNVLSANHDLYGIAAICPDGRAVGTTAKGNTLRCTMGKQDKLFEILKEAAPIYPYFNWLGSAALEEYIPKSSPLYVLISEPALVGIRATSYSPSDEVGYAIVTIREQVVQDCYRYFTEQNTAIMIDENNVIISAGNSKILGEPISYSDKLSGQSGSFKWSSMENEKSQVVYYTIESRKWTLINQIPEITYSAQKSSIMLIIFWVLIITLLLLSAFFILWILKYAKPIDKLMGEMRLVADGDLSVKPSAPSGIRELDQLENQFSVTVGRLNTLIAQLKQMEAEKHIEEIRTLQYQINPHFLYNSINSIRWLALLNGNAKVADSLATLVKIIMPVMRAPSFYWTVEEEIEFVDNYIKMMILRFGGAIDYKVECDDSLLNETFPRFVLQPLIENCFTHGMSSNENMKIRINIIHEDGFFHATVANSGLVIDHATLIELNRKLSDPSAQLKDDESIGLPNVNKRLFLLYGSNSRIYIESQKDQKTVVHLRFKDRPED